MESTNVFASALDQALQGNIIWSSDTIKMLLLTASATPSLETWVYHSDVADEVASGSGYTTGGVTLGTKTHVTTAANSWGTSWASTNAQQVGDIVIPGTPNGLLYSCVVAGTTGGSEPSWPTVVGESVTDSGATWTCLGESVTVYSSASASWSAATFSTAYGVIYDAQTGVSATEPLIALITFGVTLSPASGTLALAPAAEGWFFLSPA